MSLISDSKYRKACTDFIENALLRPRMYFGSLKELEAIMRGHGTAFDQLGLIDRDSSFHSSFGDWLYENKGASSSSGWAYAIESLASIKGDDSEKLFSMLVREFLAHWNDIERQTI